MEETNHGNRVQRSSILDDMKYLDADSTTLASVEVLSSHVILPGIAQVNIGTAIKEEAYDETSTYEQQENSSFYSSCDNAATAAGSCNSRSQDPNRKGLFEQYLDSTDASLQASYPPCYNCNDPELVQHQFPSNAESKADRGHPVCTQEARLHVDHQKKLVRTNTCKLCNESSETRNFSATNSTPGEEQDENRQAPDETDSACDSDTSEDAFEEVILCDKGCCHEAMPIPIGNRLDQNSGVSSGDEKTATACHEAPDCFRSPIASNSKCTMHVRLKAWETPSVDSEDEQGAFANREACGDIHPGETANCNVDKVGAFKLTTNQEQKCTVINAEISQPNSPPLPTDSQCDQLTEMSKQSEKRESATFKLFDELPHEIFFKVLGYFTLRELCVTLAPVCRAWYEYSQSPVLWQDLDLSATPDISSNQLCTLLERATLLKTLRLRGRQQLSVCEIAMLKVCPLLTRLDFGFCDNVNWTVLGEIVRCCQNLQVVNMEGCDQIDDQVASHFPLLPCLKMLNLSHCTKMTDEAVLLIGQGCLLLEELNVDGIPWITDRAIKLLAAQRSGTLRAVYLDGAELTDASITYLIGCPLLHTLSLSFCEQLTDEALNGESFETSPIEAGG